MEDYKNPHQEGATFKPEELTISFDVPFTVQTVLYVGSPVEPENETYLKQVAFLDQFCSEEYGKANTRVLPVRIDRKGVTLLTAFNEEMQKVLPSLIEAMSAISGVEVTYSLMTNDSRDDVVYDFDLSAHRLKTDEELWAEYLAN